MRRDTFPSKNKYFSSDFDVRKGGRKFTHSDISVISWHISKDIYIHIYIYKEHNVIPNYDDEAKVAPTRIKG